LMAKGTHYQLTAPFSMQPSIDDQKALGILIETIEVSQYHNRHETCPHSLRSTRSPPSADKKIDRIQVAMEWAKLTWDPRQETLPDFIYRFQAECRKKIRESGRHRAKMRDTKEDHSNAAVYMFSRFENGHDQDMVNSDDESKDNEDIQPTVIDAGNTEPIYLGEPGEVLPLRTDPDYRSSKPKDSDNDADMALSAEDCDTRTIEHRIVIDSGASTHMTGAPDHLYAKTPCNRQVIVANGGVTTATLMGKLNISTPTPSTLTLTDVLLIKGMTTTLLSVPALMRANPKIRVEFQRDKCTILLGSKTVARATISNDQRLYILKGVFTHESVNSAATVADQIALWHHRIGHILYPLKRSEHAPKPGPLLIASVGGYRYYTAYVDDCTHYKIVRFVYTAAA
ncbi:hypothetical protein DYB32_009514, partial [Aphanomyces invadans]